MAGTADARSVFESGLLSNGATLLEERLGGAVEPCVVDVAFGGLTLLDEEGATFIRLSAATRLF